MCPKTQVSIHATITGFSRNGAIAFVKAEGYKSLSFSLLPTDDVWSEDHEPEVGEVVVISDIRKYTRGWRAMSARRFTKEDESTNSA